MDRFLFGFTASAQRSNSLISTPNKQELRTSDDPSAATADRARRSNAEVPSNVLTRGAADSTRAISSSKMNGTRRLSDASSNEDLPSFERVKSQVCNFLHDV